MDKPRKHRPKIALFCPPTVVPGEPFTANVHIDAKAPVDVDFVDLHLRGKEWAAIGSGKNRWTKQIEICDQRYRLSGATRLPGGATTYQQQLMLPASAPPSYRTPDARAVYEIKIRISIPWWLDARGTYEIDVGLAKPAGVHPGVPRLIASASEQPSSGDPYVEASFAGDVFTPGDVVAGTVALANVASNRYHGIKINLVGIEKVTISRWRTGESRRTDLGITLPLDEPGEGEAHPFRFRLPEHLAPTCAASLWRLDYHLEVRAQLRWASDLRLHVPVGLVPKRFRAAEVKDRRPPPTIGSGRLQAIWQHAADRFGHELDGDIVRGRVGNIDLTVCREHRGRGGTFLLAELSYPDLGLDLAIQPPGGRGKRGRDGLQLEAPAWDKRHFVSCREAAQGQAYLAGIQRQLTRFRTVVMSDTAARIEVRNAGTVTAKVTAFVGDVTRLAESMGALRAHIPPPAAFAGAVARWRALAKELAGTFDPASVAIRGSLAGLPAEVRTVWAATGSPLQTRLQINPSGAIGEAYRFEAASPIDPTTADELDADGRETLRRIADGALRVAITTDAITAEIPPVIDFPEPLRQRLWQMAQLVRQLAPGAGPYR